MSRRRRPAYPGHNPPELASPRASDHLPPNSTPARANPLDKMRATHRAHIDAALASIGLPRLADSSVSPGGTAH